MGFISVILRQLITVYFGSTLLYFYYKIRGKDIKLSQILNEEDEFGLKKYRITAFYLGLFFIMFILLTTVGIVRKYNL